MEQFRRNSESALIGGDIVQKTIAQLVKHIIEPFGKNRTRIESLFKGNPNFQNVTEAFQKNIEVKATHLEY